MVLKELESSVLREGNFCWTHRRDGMLPGNVLCPLWDPSSCESAAGIRTRTGLCPCWRWPESPPWASLAVGSSGLCSPEWASAVKSKDDFVAKALRQDLVKAKMVSWPSLCHLGHIISHLKGLVSHLYHWDKKSVFFCLLRAEVFWTQLLWCFCLCGIYRKMVWISVVTCVNDITTHKLEFDLGLGAGIWEQNLVPNM